MRFGFCLIIQALHSTGILGYTALVLAMEPTMNTLSLRTYNTRSQLHQHSYTQLVLPVAGEISIEVEDFSGEVGIGECVLIRPSQVHRFSAPDAARFIVADCDPLPKMLTEAPVVFTIDAPLKSFLLFVEIQLQSRSDSATEALLFNLFTHLLSAQPKQPQLDSRIRRVLAFIESHITEPLKIAQLADIACLSPTQFKKHFREGTGQSVQDYLTTQRMERARALLTHTDLPVQQVAEQVGYTDISAFSRRFSLYFKQSPRHFMG